MRYNPEKHHRRSIRLKGYDYSQPGLYFVTIYTNNRDRMFGDVVDDEMVLNGFGIIIKYTWFDLPNHKDHIKLDVFTIMPNHVHGIIRIFDDNTIRAGSEPALTNNQNRHGLPEIIRQFKTFSARRINNKSNISGVAVWQRNYFEHIIRDEDKLNRIRLYIQNNPLNWKEDDYHI